MNILEMVKSYRGMDKSIIRKIGKEYEYLPSRLGLKIQIDNKNLIKELNKIKAIFPYSSVREDFKINRNTSIEVSFGEDSFFLDIFHKGGSLKFHYGYIFDDWALTTDILNNQLLETILYCINLIKLFDENGAKTLNFKLTLMQKLRAIKDN